MQENGGADAKEEEGGNQINSSLAVYPSRYRGLDGGDLCGVTQISMEI